MSRTFQSLILALTLLAMAPNADAQVQNAAPPAQWERGVFVPSAGYKRTVDMLRYERLILAASARAGAPKTRPTALTGTRNLPVILVSFKNRPPTFKAPEYARVLFSDRPTEYQPPMKTVSQYYRDVSSGRFDVRGTVTDWYPTSKDDTYYENNVLDSQGAIVQLNNGSGKPFGELLEEALKHADQDLDFAAFDNDGPDGIPNSGDDDGKVDTVLIIHSEAGGECQGADLANIWSHSWHYSDSSYGHNGPFETRAIRKDRAGNPVLKPDGSTEHIVIEDYTIQPGIACHDASGQERIIDIGVICHEYGHALGLPDLYDRTPTANPDSSGIGDYCLMAGGAYGADDVHPELPVYLSAWSRAFLGWASLRPIQDGPLTFEPAVLRGSAYWFDVPGTGGKEYFLVEYRDKDAQPSPGHVNWDAGLPASGLAVWHVDDRVGEEFKSWPFTPLDKGQNDAASLPLHGGGGFEQAHSLVALVQADGKLELEHGKNRFGIGDLWTDTTDFHDDPKCIAGARGYDGKPTGLRLDMIHLAAGDLRAATNELQAETNEIHVAAAPAPLARAIPAPPPVPAQPGANLSKETGVSVDSADLDRAITKLLSENRSEEVHILRAPDAKWIRAITGLSVPSRGGAQAAASRLLMRDFRELTGAVALKAVPSASGAIKFEQAIHVDGEQLPLFNFGAVAHYDGKYLKAITTEIVDPTKLVVTGNNTTMTVDQAKARVAALLKVPLDKIISAREGVHLIDDDPARARVAYQVLVSSGSSQVPISVVLDEATREVLDVK